LSKEQVARLGRIDILMVPIDGVSTMSHEEVLHVAGQIQPKIIMPMHFSFGAPEMFVELVARRHRVRRLDSTFIEISRADLPEKTELLILGNQF